MKEKEIVLLVPGNWKQYELLDCGDFIKIENFAGVITIRPEPQAIWRLSKPLEYWKKKAHWQFLPTGPQNGKWTSLNKAPEKWTIEYRPQGIQKAIKMRLSLTQFKHVGVFPEQAENWDYIVNITSHWTQPFKVLNLFAYTGGASLAAKLSGADVYHVDAIRQVVTWANENQILTGVRDIRWVVEDAMKFVRRLKKREETFHGIIMDPPAFGHGPKGETWKLERDLRDLLDITFDLLHPDKHFFIINTYSLGFSSVILHNLVKEKAGHAENYEWGELGLKDAFGKILPLGVFARFYK